MGKFLELFDKNKKPIDIAEVMRIVYFDIPDVEMTYAIYDTKAYFDKSGWYLIDSNGNKQYEDEKYLRITNNQS